MSPRDPNSDATGSISQMRWGASHRMANPAGGASRRSPACWLRGRRSDAGAITTFIAIDAERRGLPLALLVKLSPTLRGQVITDHWLSPAEEAHSCAVVR